LSSGRFKNYRGKISFSLDSNLVHNCTQQLLKLLLVVKNYYWLLKIIIGYYYLKLISPSPSLCCFSSFYNNSLRLLDRHIHIHNNTNDVEICGETFKIKSRGNYLFCEIKYRNYIPPLDILSRSCALVGLAGRLSAANEHGANIIPQ